MTELLQKIDQRKVYVDTYKTYMVPLSDVNRLISEEFNNNFSSAVDSITEELEKIQKDINSIRFDD